MVDTWTCVRLAYIVLRKSGLQIVRDAGVEMLRVLLALQNVDVFQREVRLRKEAPARQLRSLIFLACRAVARRY